MTDDDDVYTARQALLVEINECLERAFAQSGKGSGAIVARITGLIAAVRAEHLSHDGCDWGCNPCVAPCGAKFCTYEEMAHHTRHCPQVTRDG